MAGGANFDDDDGGITDINVTPFVDVMLVLLVIFMVTANYIVNQSISVNLPNADSGETIKAKNLGLVVDAESNYYLNGNPIKLNELPVAIKTQKADSSTGQVNALIAADEMTPHGAVVKLIDVLRKGGITDFAINVEAGQSQ